MENKFLTEEELDELLIKHMPRANEILDRLEEERDKNQPPHVFSTRHERSINKIIKKYNKGYYQNRYTHLLKYAAVILVTFILANSLLIVTVQAYRESLIRIITTVYKTFTSIVIDGENISDVSDAKIRFSEPSYIPDGFKILSYIETGTTRKINYVNDERIIVFMQKTTTAEEILIDTEGTEIKEIEINKIKVKYVFNKGMYYAYWYESEFGCSVNAEVSFDELTKIIKGIIKK